MWLFFFKSFANLCEFKLFVMLKKKNKTLIEFYGDSTLALEIVLGETDIKLLSLQTHEQNTHLRSLVFRLS